MSSVCHNVAPVPKFSICSQNGRDRDVEGFILMLPQAAHCRRSGRKVLALFTPRCITGHPC